MKEEIADLKAALLEQSNSEPDLMTEILDLLAKLDARITRLENNA